MSNAYQECNNLIGVPICNANVVNMQNTYRNCINLSGAPVCNVNVVDMRGTYYNCPNLTGNMFMLSNNVRYANDMLAYHNEYNTINIYVYEDTITNSTLSNYYGIGCGRWTYDEPNNCYYNSMFNVYVYYN